MVVWSFLVEGGKRAAVRLLLFLVKVMAFLMGQQVKNLPLIQEMQVRSLGPEDPLEEGMATHASILAEKVPWAEEPGVLRFTGSQRVRQGEATEHWCWLKEQSYSEDPSVLQR